VDVNGELIGINTQILSRSGGSNGIGFAIPSALVAQFVAQARAGETQFQRPWAGLGGQPVSADLAEGLGLDRPGGLVISEVHPQSAFAAAGIAPGDVISAVDGQPVNTPAEMIFRMSVAGIGAEATITRLRQGQAEEITLTLTAPPDTPPRAQSQTGRSAAIPGMTVSTINPVVLAQYDLPLAASGVVVDDPGPVGARVGLRPGDILRKVNGVDVANTDSALALLTDARGRLTLEVQRGGQRLVMRFRL